MWHVENIALAVFIAERMILGVSIWWQDLNVWSRPTDRHATIVIVSFVVSSSLSVSMNTEVYWYAQIGRKWNKSGFIDGAESNLLRASSGYAAWCLYSVASDGHMAIRVVWPYSRPQW